MRKKKLGNNFDFTLWHLIILIVFYFLFGRSLASTTGAKTFVKFIFLFPFFNWKAVVSGLHSRVMIIKYQLIVEMRHWGINSESCENGIIWFVHWIVYSVHRATPGLIIWSQSATQSDVAGRTTNQHWADIWAFCFAGKSVISDIL